MTFIQHTAMSILSYTKTVSLLVWHFIRRGLYLLQRPLAFLIAVFIMLNIVSLTWSVAIGLMTFTSPTTSILNLLRHGFYPQFLVDLFSTISNSLRAVGGRFLSPCALPVVGRWLLCLPRKATTSPFSDLADIQASSFDSLWNASLVGTGIALDISRLGAIALPTLINMIAHTNLTGKDVLIEALEKVEAQAPLTSRSLQQFGSAVEEGLAVVLATNKVAMYRIEAGIHPSYSLIPGKPVVPDIQLFERAIKVFESAIDTLNIAAVACNHDLDRLQVSLATVEKIVHELHWSESWERERLLSELWTFVGGNRQRLAGYSQNILQLEAALVFEQRAKSHVVEARFTLDRMSKRISDLKRKYFGKEAAELTDSVALQIHYEVLATSIRQLTIIQAKGLEGDEEYYKKIRLT